MIERLKYVLYEMNKLADSGWLRPEGVGTFQAARAELVDTIDTYEAPAVVVPPPPDIVYQVMTADQVEEIKHGIRDQMEASDVAMMAALVESQEATVAALAPTA